MSVTDSTTPGTDAYVGMLESMSRTPEQKRRARNLGIGYFVAAGIALVLVATLPRSGARAPRTHATQS